MRPLAPLLLALGLSSTALTLSAQARADVSAWVFVGGGAVGWKMQPAPPPAAQPGAPPAPPPGKDDPKTDTGGFNANGTLAFDAGVGSSPDGRFIVGGFFRLQPVLKHGTDMVLSARVATHGFQAGDFGLALDAGGYVRLWETKSQGFAGGLTLGAPLGLQLSLQATVGTSSAVGFGAVAGIDLLRLTIYRQTFLNRWQNPSPAWTRVGTALGLAGHRE